MLVGMDRSCGVDSDIDLDLLLHEIENSTQKITFLDFPDLGLLHVNDLDLHACQLNRRHFVSFRYHIWYKRRTTWTDTPILG